MAEKKRTGKKKPNRSNLTGVITIAGIVAVLLVVLLSGSQKLSVRNEQYESQKEELSQQIQDEEVRSGEIEKLKDDSVFDKDKIALVEAEGLRQFKRIYREDGQRKTGTRLSERNYFQGCTVTGDT